MSDFLTLSKNYEPNSDLELVFLGTSAAIQVPSFHCTCEICETARQIPEHHRTRASAALLGEEIVLIDPGPDMEIQLKREAIRRLDRIFITHWHFDHVWGFAALGEPASIEQWPPIEIYLPHRVGKLFTQQLGHMEEQVILHPVQPGDMVELPDATWEVVKTTHTEHSVGSIVESSKRFAYLVDGVVPPKETIERLNDIDILILEASVDELVLGEDEERWYNFSLPQALEFWKLVGAEMCILTHMSCHSWNRGRLVAGLSNAERLDYERRVKGLKFAYDGMRIKLM